MLMIAVSEYARVLLWFPAIIMRNALASLIAVKMQVTRRCLNVVRPYQPW